MNELLKLHQRITELEASESKHRTLVEISPDIIYVLDPKGCFSFVGNAVEDLIGFTTEELIGKHFSSIICPDDLKNAMWLFHERRTRKRSIESFEVRLITKENKKKYFDIKYLPVELYAFGFYNKPVSSKDKEFLGTYGVARDITKRKRAEKALRKSEEKYRTIFEDSMDAIYINTQEGEFVDVNQSMLELFGYTREEMIGMNAINIYANPLDRSESLRQIAQKESHKEYEIRFKKKDGEEMDCLLTATVKRADNGRVVGYQGVVRDITHNKRVEYSLRESEEKYRTILKNIEDAYYEVDIRGNFTFFNDSLCKISGYTRDELMGMNNRQYMDQENVKKAYQTFSRVYNTGKPDKGFDYEYIRKDDTKGYADASTSLIKDAKGQRIGFRGIIRDIAERKQAEEKIKTSLKEKEVMLKEIHHRVKNNMQVISSLLKLQSGYIKDKEALEIFKKSTSHVRLMALIHEKLYQSKDLARIDFAEYVRGLTSYLLVMYNVSSSLIKLNIDVKNVFLDINTAIPCSLIINELVSNAFKYAFQDGKKGKIKIALHHINKNKFELIVSDNGIGFPKDLDFRNTESLGLQLVITLVKQLGGAIELHSNGGTEFKISFTL